MKTIISVIAAVTLFFNLAFAQKSEADKLEIGVGGTFAKPKIIPGLTKLAVAQATINYKLTTTTRVVGKEKGTGAIAGAKLTAFLETTDGKLTDEDFQECSNHFVTYLTQKLNENGITTVPWASITGTEFYKNSAEKTAEGSGENGANVWVTNTANAGNIMYGGGIAFAFGKAKKAGAFCEELGAPAAFFHITVDFADIYLDVDIKSTEHEGYYMITKTRTWKYNSAVNAEMKVIPSSLGMTLFWNEKMGSESLYPVQDISSGMPYQDHISQDTERMKNSMWAFSKEMEPVVIETTREKYKAAAKAALERYADAFIAKHKETK